MGDYDWKTTDFSLSGFAHLHKALDGLTDIQKSIGLSPLLEDSLKPMAVVAASIAPDDPITGPPWNLNTSIEVSTHQRTGRAKIERPLGRFEARAYMGPTKFGYPEAIFAEFGTTQRHQKKSGKSVGMMAARPYMRPAWDSGKQGALEIIKAGYADRVFKTAQLFAVAPSR